jgi:alpha-tubulin suppressor-like RCC1 family protein
MTAMVPTQVPNVTDCAQIAGGAQHVCVVRKAGTVACWGSNASGQGGQAPAGSPTLTSPTTVAGLGDVAELKAGEKYSCARKNDMTVWCWGDNGFGQLGDGTTSNHATPAPVGGLGADIVEIAAGRFSVCARHANGKASCWGQNDYGQLGNGTTTNSGVPVDVAGVADATQLALGITHACVLRRSGVVSCWGGNMNGQLGIGTTTTSPVVVDVKDLTSVTSIAAGSVHTCARHAAGLACWGENVVNQLGDGTTTDRWSPVSVAGFQ